MKIKAYVTVFYSLIVSVILLLLVGFIYGVRENAIRLKTSCAMNASMDALASEYNSELFRQYGLLYVDMGYQSESVGRTLPEEHLKNFLNKNFNEETLGIWDGIDLMKLSCTGADVNKLKLATDNKGAGLRSAISDYMLRNVKLKYLEDFTDVISSYEELEISSEEAMEKLSERADTPSRQKILAEAGLPDLKVEKEEDTMLSTFSTLRLLLSDEELSKVSTIETEPKNYASKRRLNRGNWEKEETGIIEGAADKLLLREYILLMCGSYTEPKEDSLLDYETEYIIYGNRKDSHNLEKVANRLLLFRIYMNYRLIEDNEAEKALIETSALAICTFLGIPDATEAVAAVIEGALATYRGVDNVKDLFHGMKVRLYDEESPELSYEDYLMIFLFLTDTDKVTMRLMDIMEMDIRKTENNEWFLMDNCFNAIDISAYVKSDYGYSYEIDREYVMQ